MGKQQQKVKVAAEEAWPSRSRSGVTAEEAWPSRSRSGVVAEEAWSSRSRSGVTAEEAWPSRSRSGVAAEEAWSSRSRSGVMLEGYVENRSDGREGFGRTKSLTDDDLDELKGCLDLGFGFSYDDIPELCNTLPALELCYSMSQRFLDDQQQIRSNEDGVEGESSDPSSTSIATWRISSPGDDPDEVKARLRYWAQAVACTVKLCN